jgi:hypothetical protein
LCAWNLKTIPCDKGDDKKCTDVTLFGAGSCCFYAKHAALAVITATFAAELSLKGYPSVKDTEQYFCVQKTSVANMGFLGWSALLTKQTKDTLATKFDFSHDSVDLA